MFDCYRPGARAVADMVAWSKNGHETAAERRFNPAFSKEELFRLGYISRTHSQHFDRRPRLDLTLVDLTADNSGVFEPKTRPMPIATAAALDAAAGGQYRHGNRL